MREPPVVTPDSDGRPRPLELRRMDAATLGRAAVAVAVACAVSLVRLAPAGEDVWRVVAMWAGLLAVLAVLPLSRGSLRLTPEGFSVKGVGRRTHNRWRDVSGVAVHRERGHTYAMVWLVHDERQRLMRLESFGLPEAQLVTLLEEYRARALAPTRPGDADRFGNRTG